MSCEPQPVPLRARTLALLVTLVLAACQPSGWPADPLSPHPARATPDVAGIRLGDTLDSVRERFAGARCKPVDTQDITEQCVIGGQAFAGAGEAAVYASFAHRRTVIVQAYGLPAAGMGTMVRALSARYGTPDDLRHRPPRTPANAVSWSTDAWFLVAMPAASGRPHAGAILYQRQFVRDVERAAGHRGETVPD
ncbi:MAG: hypothetical protein KGN77_06240 [Xanthomonadaceae bacterium]|nr:hypothetical protein [Xanthomonadaceae bacterium]MDE1965338.1 hypothetical protein [Xanthomonadaceae bacterium]